MLFRPNRNFWLGDFRADQTHSFVAIFMNGIPDLANTLPNRW
jgi:hypothetical protein